MYTHSILFYLSWLVLILVSYWLIRMAVKNFEERWNEPEKD